jgi:hypothetical protein
MLAWGGFPRVGFFCLAVTVLAAAVSTSRSETRPHGWRSWPYGRAQLPPNRASRVHHAEVCVRTCTSDR